MMAARAGAGEVHSLEMVPALAAVARHIAAVNGFGETVRIHTARSTEVDAAALGGKFDILVCEIVDDMLLGEGVLTSVSDARTRLLSPSACVLPRGGAIWALAVEMRPQMRDGIALDDQMIFLCDLSTTPEPLANVKLQHLAPGKDYRPLAAPLRLFDFDWAGCSPPDALCARRTTQPLPMRITSDGVLSALLVYFTIDLDGDPANGYGNGPEFARSHWEQNCRWLPHELKVRRGERLTLIAHHDDHHVAWLRIPDVRPRHLEGMVGHAHIVGLPMMQDAAVALDYASRN